MTDRPPPRRRDAAQTKARILAAASEVFAELGYARAGLRDIAAKADVASSLLVRHFGTKAALFEQALIDTVRRNTVFTWDKEDFGAKMAALVAEHSTTRITVFIVLALADPESAQIARRVSQQQMIAPLAEWLGPPHATERAMNMFALLSGFVIQMQGLSSAPMPAQSLDWLARSLQQIVDAR